MSGGHRGGPADPQVVCAKRKAFELVVDQVLDEQYNWVYYMEDKKTTTAGPRRFPRELLHKLLYAAADLPYKACCKVQLPSSLVPLFMQKKSTGQSIMWEISNSRLDTAYNDVTCYSKKFDLFLIVQRRFRSFADLELPLLPSDSDSEGDIVKLEEP